jgi:DNA repair protein RadC
LFLDNQHRVIASEALFYGTIDQASVYPREVIRACIQHNAAAVIFAHNHPSGSAEPSQADKRMTTQLGKALALIDIRMLDHIIVAGSITVSMAEMGMI